MKGNRQPYNAKGVDYADVVRRLKAGERVKDVAKIWGVSPPAISRGAKLHGLPRRSYQRRPVAGQRRQALVSLFAQYEARA